jgi:hypothetical protein
MATTARGPWSRCLLGLALAAPSQEPSPPPSPAPATASEAPLSPERIKERERNVLLTVSTVLLGE